ncbi:3D-(3,5/4)-trihydroxycyclohexane-1,2-dione acylhydrolase (decyclizing) [Rhodovibrio sodomensis]|uniref:3D-(3,5/4)-trihydroxycyclohexane-1,2-dione acylhydrolase (Decyclizing) n=1 Tax=Rhodovibrio sodomensis TaxID=1088 RepID=A0ABS1DM02_9PROT|nr:3D-(3,5/4)-trihydroxycyclohexane-1,2-dione acylhydrolase (decyclizing) [Rhodovibrio sodomensis]MBK1670763.1 3D-(3,5/4)-trihydroxycyclohexane-1,2-dione acylhydrolase (decyclizing) [Rhodovibrio sodomensis]
MGTVRLTAAQALVRYLSQQRTELEDGPAPLFAGVWAIFGHGNVAGLGDALARRTQTLPTYRGHNEQAMAHAAIAYAKARNRLQMMAVTTSIGPGATNMVTAAALAHVNRLPVLLLPGDVFADRRPDPVLQQIEDPQDATVTANDAFRPVSRYFDRITRPEQLLNALPRAIQTLTDPAACGPVTLALCQDVQTQAYDFPDAFFEPTMRRPRRPAPDPDELAQAAEALAGAEQPLVVAGGGVQYARANARLADFARAHGLPVAETQAGKGTLAWDHPCNVGSVGVTGSSAANALAAEADVVLAIGTRLQDFTTASRTLFQNPQLRQINLNVAAADAGKHGALPLVGDAGTTLAALDDRLDGYCAPEAWRRRMADEKQVWDEIVARTTAHSNAERPSDMAVIGAVNRAAGPSDTVVCAAGGLPGELHKLWRAQGPGTYHVEYGYSCMGYEIAGGLGAKMADPSREVFVMVGDGSYLMLNSEIATSVMLERKLIVVLLDNQGFGSIHRLQQACGGAPFNNRFANTTYNRQVSVDYAAHARALGAEAEKVQGIADLEAALHRARLSECSYVVVIETDPDASSDAGGAFWDVAVAEVSGDPKTRRARTDYEAQRQNQRMT